MLERELEAQNQENKKLKEQIIASAVAEVKEAIATEREDLMSDMRSHVEEAKRAEEKVWKAKSNVAAAAKDVERAREKMEEERSSLERTIRAGIGLAAVNFWIVAPVGLIAGVAGHAAGKTLIEGTAWTAMEVLIGSMIVAAGVPLVVGILNVLTGR